MDGRFFSSHKEYMMLRGRLSIHRALILTVIAFASATVASRPAGAQTFRPSADGTLVDGGVFGTFDGQPDAWDWRFNGTGYDGSITLSTPTPAGSLEHRIIWEYDVRSVSFELPITATLVIVARGVALAPAPDANVHVYSYPANLLESPDDYTAGPAVLEGYFNVPPYSPGTEYRVDVSRAVNAVLSSGLGKVGFRFQIDPDTPYTTSQAFIDASDGSPPSKPGLVIEDLVPGDVNGDGVTDTADYFGFSDCMAGPDVRPVAGCEEFDFDHDRDVDQEDFRRFTEYVPGS